jgi:hypothetical protein
VLSLVDFAVMAWVQDDSLTTIVLMNRCGNVAAILKLDENLNKKVQSLKQPLRSV